MKRCPICNRVYTDPTVIYCLADGNFLSPATDPNLKETVPGRIDAQAVTEVMPSAELPHRPIAPTLPSPPSPTWQPGYATPQPAPAKGDRKVLLLVCVGVLLAAVVVLTYFLLRKGSDETRVSVSADSSNLATPNANSTSVNPTQTPTATPTVTPSPTATPTPTSDTAVARAEVIAVMNSWAESLRRQDLNANMSFYADDLDAYYQLGSISRDQVRANRQAIFTRYYSSTNVQLSNIDVEIDSTGTTATVRYDNAYNWRGGPKYLVGKSRNEIELSKEGSRWLVTSEKHLQTYYEDTGN